MPPLIIHVIIVPALLMLCVEGLGYVFRDRIKGRGESVLRAGSAAVGIAYMGLWIWLLTKRVEALILLAAFLAVTFPAVYAFDRGRLKWLDRLQEDHDAIERRGERKPLALRVIGVVLITLVALGVMAVVWPLLKG